MMEFDRKATVQAQDSFSTKEAIGEIDAFIREQKVPGELTISYPGNGGISSAIFRNKPRLYRGEIEES